MKNIVRLAVAALALAGFAASSVISHASKSTNHVVVAAIGSGATAACPYNDPNACGID